MAFAVCLAMGGRLGDNYGRRRLFDLSMRPVRRRLVALRAGRFGLAAAGGARPAGRRRGADRAADSRHPACQPQRPRAFPRAGACSIGGLAFVVMARCSAASWSPADIGGLGLAQRVPDQPADLPRHSRCSRRWVPETRAEHAARVDAPGTLLLHAALIPPLPFAAGSPAHRCTGPGPTRPAAGGGDAVAELAVAREVRAGTPPGLAVAAAVLLLPSIRFGLLLAILFLRLLERLHVRPRPGPAGRRRSLAGTGRQCLRRPRRLLLRLGPAHRPGGGADRR
ncbi:hypothetical protein ACPA9J_14095 [Pseudomonas aeruginosa]